jgi:RNA polymerase sigma-70 factor (ECF subfamily)
MEKSKDEEKFELLYMEYKNLMFYVANKILGNTKDAEDAVQDAFVKIVEVIDKIDTVKSPKTKGFVVTIVERKAIDIYRSKQRKPVVAFNKQIFCIPKGEDLLSLTDQSPFAVAIALLPIKYRELLLLKYDTGFSEKEIAKLLSMSEANVHKTIQRAKKKLSEKLKEQEAEA